MTRPRTLPRKMNQRYVRCTLCSKEITLNNFTTHLHTKHGEHYRAGAGNRSQFYTELDEQPPGVELAVVARAASLPAPMADLPPLHAEDLDQIVLAVVQQLADRQGRIPAHFLPAIFAWRAATSVFLRAVTRE